MPAPSHVSEVPAPPAAYTYCPPRPQADTPEALGFRRQPMVRWLAPGELVRAGVKALLSSLFGAYADKREVQALQAGQLLARAAEGDGRAALDELIRREVCDFSDRGEVWIDYVADLGDGWDATYTVARLLAEETLPLGPGGPETRRGEILVMGGDQVYPTATREEYNDRLVGPYRAALPCVPDAAAPPRLFAVPGNHDWYDGLTSFYRLFCQERWIGGWKTEQRRSYFAVRLPHDWWLWGIDVQLGSDIDLPQIEYFETLASDPDLMPKGSKVILCVAEPSWVFSSQKGAEAYKNLAYFEKNLICDKGHEHVVGLAGDLHAYARYEEQPPPGAPPLHRRKQRFISGGGGAYLYPTHQLPEDLYPQRGLPPDYVAEGLRDQHFSSRKPGRATGGEGNSVFPGAAMSRLLALRSLVLPFKNPDFSLLLGAFYLFFAWLAQSASVHDAAAGSLLTAFTQTGFGGALAQTWDVVKHGPGSALVLLLLWGGLVGFADVKTGWGKLLLGSAHTLAHGLAMVGLMQLFARLNAALLGGRYDGDPAALVDAWPHVALFAAEMLVVGGLVAGFVFALYMLLANLLLRVRAGVKGVHANEVFSSQVLPDFKNFLRLHIDAQGQLTIYPVGVRRVCRRWRLVPSGPAGAPWFEPADGAIGTRAELIEDPVVVD